MARFRARLSSVLDSYCSCKERHLLRDQSIAVVLSNSPTSKENYSGRTLVWVRARASKGLDHTNQRTRIGGWLELVTR